VYEVAYVFVLIRRRNSPSDQRSILKVQRAKTNKNKTGFLGTIPAGIADRSDPFFSIEPLFRLVEAPLFQYHP
jgi:hypothetical protein